MLRQFDCTKAEMSRRSLPERIKHAVPVTANHLQLSKDSIVANSCRLLLTPLLIRPHV